MNTTLTTIDNATTVAQTEQYSITQISAAEETASRVASLFEADFSVYADLEHNL